MEQNSIVDILYKQYYRNDQTPKELVSSHWAELHEKVDVKRKNRHFKVLKGYGFGDMQGQSISSKMFTWLNIVSYLFVLEDRVEIIKMMKVAFKVLKRMEFPFTYDCFRQVCSLVLIKKVSPGKKLSRIINIGDGYGFLSSLIKEVFPDAKICLVDLGKTLLFQAFYCRKVHPDRCHYLVSKERADKEDILGRDFMYCAAEDIGMLGNMSFDVAINITSMQEMAGNSISIYFDFLRRHLAEDNLFYCCNREEKHMPAGEVSRFLDYPWMEEDKHLLDDKCPWCRYQIAFRKAQRGPKVFNVRLPFINYFDGDVVHRASTLKTLK